MSQEIQIAIISASSALVGALISQATTFLIAALDKKHQKRVLLRQKYEEMMFQFQDSLRYAQEVHTCETLLQVYQLASSPQTGKALGLAQLYFPVLLEPLSVYAKSQLSFYCSVLENFDPNIPANVGGQCMMSKKHQEVVQKLLKAKSEVMDALSSNSQKYTKA